MIERSFIRSAFSALFISAFFSCSATYKGEKDISEGIKKICASEHIYNLEISVRRGAIIVDFLFPGVPDEKNLDNLDNQDFYKKLSSIVMASARVVLSSDQKIKFFTIKAKDSKTGRLLLFTQYIEDIKKYLYEGISRTDYYERMLLEFKSSFDEKKDPVATLDMFIYRLAVSRLLKKVKNDLYVILFQVKDIRILSHTQDTIRIKIDTVKTKKKKNNLVENMLKNEVSNIEKLYGVKTKLSLKIEGS